MEYCMSLLSIKEEEKLVAPLPRFFSVAWTWTDLGYHFFYKKIKCLYIYIYILIIIITWGLSILLFYWGFHLIVYLFNFLVKLSHNLILNLEDFLVSMSGSATFLYPNSIYSISTYWLHKIWNIVEFMEEFLLSVKLWTQHFYNNV